MSPNKAPRPDGMPAAFYQQYWSIINSSLFSWVCSVFARTSSVNQVNQTYISLIPKIPHPTYITQFKPIGLCNVNYKVVTKILVHHIQSMLGDLVGEAQASFVPGCQIVGNIIIMQEAIHSMMIKKGKSGFMAIKVDLKKAYDQLKWEFIRTTLTLVSFPTDFTDLIMDCITSPR